MLVTIVARPLLRKEISRNTLSHIQNKVSFISGPEMKPKEAYQVSGKTW